MSKYWTEMSSFWKDGDFEDPTCLTMNSLLFLLSSLPPHLLFIYSTTTSRASVIVLGKHRGLKCKRGLTDAISPQRNLKHPWIQSASIFWLSTMLKCCVEVKKEKKMCTVPWRNFCLEGGLPSCLRSILVVLLFYCVFPLLPPSQCTSLCAELKVMKIPTVISSSHIPV